MLRTYVTYIYNVHMSCTYVTYIYYVNMSRTYVMYSYHTANIVCSIASISSGILDIGQRVGMYACVCMRVYVRVCATHMCVCVRVCVRVLCVHCV